MAEESGISDSGAGGRFSPWHRLRDHRIAQWGVGYVALAFGIQQGVALIADAFEWPHAVTRVSILLLALGLPVVMALAWYHGERVSRRVTAGEMTIIAILLVIGSLLFYVFVRPSNQTANTAPAKPQSTAISAAPAPSGVSVAVLPFLNLSSDREQDFFSDGMTEEITSALAKVKGLRVVARTSAFQFKGENKDMRAVGQALGATDLIEGSVRKDGNQVRITAQLIRAADGTHLWTESYDRELKSVFAVQEDIAQAIAGALQIPLGLKQGEHLVSARTSNTGSYQDYLRARAFFRVRDTVQAISVLEQAVAHDPGYAPAWALLAQTYSLAPILMFSPFDGSVEQVSARSLPYAQKAERAAQQALRLEPRNAAAITALGEVATHRLDWTAADGLFRRALALDPDDPELLNDYSYNFLYVAGYLKQALDVREKLRKLEPLTPAYNIITASLLLTQGRYQTAIDLLQAPATGGPSRFGRNNRLAHALSDAGRYGEAADILLASPPTPQISRTATENAARILRSAPAAAAGPDNPHEFEQLAFMYRVAGEPSRAMEFPERLVVSAGLPKSAIGDLWEPLYAPLRKTERFKALMRKARLVDYWRSHGWPDLCHPVGAGDFACN